MRKHPGYKMMKRTAGKICCLGFAGVLLCCSLIWGTGKKYALAEQDTKTSDAGNILLGGGAAVSGQVESLGYATQLYDATNGLPTSDANAILSASDGFIWIGGYSGLIRYDGTTFERQDSSSGVTNVNALYEDKKKRLWVGTNDNGVVMLEEGKSVHWGYKEGLSASSICAITEDGDGNIFVGTKQGIFCIDDDGTVAVPDAPQLSSAYILSMKTGEGGAIYGNTKDGAVFCISKGKEVSFYFGDDMGIGHITSLLPVPDETGKIYLGTNSGAIYLGDFADNLKNLKKIPVSLTDGTVTSINSINLASGRIWLICENTIGYLDENNEFHQLSNLPMESSVGSMIEDYEGNLWFTSNRQGVMKIVANKFSNVSEAAGLKDEVVNSTCLHDGKLYIGTDTGLRIADGEQHVTEDELQKYLGETRIRCIIEDAEKNLWICTYTNGKGLVCYTADGKIKSFTEEDGLLSNETRGAVLASDGSVLVATNGGMCVFKNEKLEKSYGADSGINNTVILAVAEGENGIYYLGTDGDGMYVVDGNNVTRKGRDEGLTSDIVMRIKKDTKRGVYWLVTSNSIEYMKNGKIIEVSRFPYSNNYDIYFDQEDNAWILSSYGIFVAKAQDLLDNKKDFEYLAYDISSGLLSVPTGNSYSALSEDGMLYIAGRSGVCSVNINHYFEQAHPIKLSVPYLEANGVRYYPNAKNEVRLPASAKMVKIYGFALTYSMQNPRLEYYLEGFDKEPASVTKQEMEPVRYTNLSGGKYTYRLSVINTSTGEVQQEMSVSIIKGKAFYEQFWFYLLATLVVTVLIVELVKHYLDKETKAYKKKEEEQKTLIREMVTAFAKTIDMKDKYTKGHSSRVAEYTVRLARELGCDEETIERYHNIALLHDIGKIGIPAEVLNKPGKLTDQEFQIIKSHSALGYNALKDISIMPELAIGAGAHHERPDGKGYPKGLKGEEIPRVAQIIAVADTFDAMYSDRPYRKRMNFEKAVSIIKEAAGTQLTKDVVEAFLRLVEKGEFRAPDDIGGGTTEDINNIHEKQNHQTPPKPQKAVTGNSLTQILIIFLSSALLFSGCSGGSPKTEERTEVSVQTEDEQADGLSGGMSDDAGVENADGDTEAGESLVAEADAGKKNAYGSAGGEEKKLQKEMLVYRCRLSIDTLDYEKSLADFKKLLKEYDCFIETENYSDNGDNYSYYYIEDSDKHSQYTATVRVPSEKYDAFLESTGSIGDVRTKNSNVENLNQEYTDTETALKIYKEQEKRYIQMIKDAEDSYALQLQKQLTELEVKIAQLESRKNKIKMDVAYSYVDLTLREVQKYSPHGKTDTFMMRLQDHLSDSWSTFLNVLETLLTIFIYVWYYLVIILVIVFIAVKQSKKNQEKRRKRMQQRQGYMPYMTGQPGMGPVNARQAAGQPGMVQQNPQATGQPGMVQKNPQMTGQPGMVQKNIQQTEPVQNVETENQNEQNKGGN